MGIETRTVDYQHQDQVFEAYMAWDPARKGPLPAIAVAHTWAGRGEFEERKARELAELGYLGFCVDVFGKGIRGSNPQENSALIQPLLDDREDLQSRLLAALKCLRAQALADSERVAAIGYCFGGLCVLDLARIGAPLRSVVSFHGLFIQPGNTAGQQIEASVLCLHGYDDPLAEPDSVMALASELSAAGADWQLHAYGGTQHAFTNPAANAPEMGALYNEAADRRSWQAMCHFMDETLGPSGRQA